MTHDAELVSGGPFCSEGVFPLKVAFYVWNELIIRALIFAGLECEAEDFSKNWCYKVMVNAQKVRDSAFDEIKNAKIVMSESSLLFSYVPANEIVRLIADYAVSYVEQSSDYVDAWYCQTSILRGEEWKKLPVSDESRKGVYDVLNAYIRQEWYRLNKSKE